MTEPNAPRDESATWPCWAGDVATLDVAGVDRRSALEAGLRAVLSLVTAAPTASATPANSVSAPIRGEGDDLAALFADLVDDLVEQFADYGNAVHDVTLDGVVRTETGGFVGWGYVEVTLPGSPAATLPRLAGRPELREGDQGRIALRATIRRD